MQLKLKKLNHSLKALSGAEGFTVLYNSIKKRKPCSILFYSQHKCASVFIPNILGALSHFSIPRLKHVDYSHIIAQSSWLYGFGAKYSHDEDFFEQFGTDLFKPNGFLYGPLRHPFILPHWHAFKTIFFLRDPRDSLVSAYHSFGFTHSIPMDPDEKARFLERRQWIQQNDIDSFCLKMAKDWSLPLLSSYRRMVQSSIKEPLVVKYEEFALSPESIIAKIFAFSKVQVSDKEVNRLSEKASPLQSNIQEESHKRSGQPGQYLVRLKSETIDEINKILYKELAFFNWA
jgi:hypothetical protein